MSEDMRLEDLDFGTAVHDGDGRTLGHLRGFDEDGFYVTLRGGLEGLSAEHVAPGGAYAEAELMWRCWDCGAMDALGEDLPVACPVCGAEGEDLYYWTED